MSQSRCHGLVLVARLWRRTSAPTRAWSGETLKLLNRDHPARRTPGALLLSTQPGGRPGRSERGPGNGPGAFKLPHWQPKGGLLVVLPLLRPWGDHSESRRNSDDALAFRSGGRGGRTQSGSA
jgi:hypothetical protein